MREIGEIALLSLQCVRVLAGERKNHFGPAEDFIGEYI